MGAGWDIGKMVWRLIKASGLKYRIDALNRVWATCQFPSLKERFILRIAGISLQDLMCFSWKITPCMYIMMHFVYRLCNVYLFYPSVQFMYYVCMYVDEYVLCYDYN